MHDVPPDGEMTNEELEIAASLTEEQLSEIDQMLLSHVHPTRSRKVAYIVGSTMMDLPNPVDGLSDVFYSSRVVKLVSMGVLVAEGDLRYMRYSEVRFP